MKKYIKILLLILVFSLSLIISGCNEKNPEESNPELADHVCVPSEWIDETPFTCGETGIQIQTCTICGKELDVRRIKKQHEFTETVVPATCTEKGTVTKVCKNCGKEMVHTIYPTGHHVGKVVVTKNPMGNEVGKKNVLCKDCKTVMKTLDHVNNGYYFNGKLSIDGRNLVNQFGMKYQLYGLSTHGLQWFGDVTNFDTIANIQETFGINTIRLAFYTDENGYCDGNEIRKKRMLEVLKRGIDYATMLGLYVIIDWHMVGATNELDKNPLTYLEESKQFFSEISKEYKYYNNILFEIMNEPNGGTTWYDCKKYAEEVIPCIRENSDGIILVGNPQWTADLISVMNDPLDKTKYTNIMYTYHFYARSHPMTYQVIKAYDKGFPVFISEFGFMNSDGNGPLDKAAGEKWLKILDERNISYVAWNISNSKGTASIFKENSSSITDVSDSNLKEWGIYLKKLYRHKSGLERLTEYK